MPGPCTVRVGVLGCADIARRRMLPAFTHAPGTTVTAVASRSAATAHAVAAQYGCAAVTGYQALLERPDVDAVYIPLPVSLHAAWAEAALRSGRHVLGEKPLTGSAARTAELVRLARERGLVLMENITFLHHSQHTEVARLLAEGAIGELRGLTAVFAIPPLPAENIRYRPELDGGALLDVGVHPLRAAQFFLGPELEVLGAALRHHPVHGVDIAGSALLRSPGGVTAHITFGMEHAYRSMYELWGSAGRIRVERALTPAPGLRPQIRLEQGECSAGLDLPADDQYAATAQAFADAVRAAQQTRQAGQACAAGHGPRTTAGDDALALARLVEVVRRHADAAGPPAPTTPPQPQGGRGPLPTPSAEVAP